MATEWEPLSPEEVKSRQEPPEAYRAAEVLTDADLSGETVPTPGRPLQPWSKLWPFVQRALSKPRPRREPDLGQIMPKIAIRRLPRKQRPAWHPRAVVLLDRRPALAPFFDDYNYLLRRLKQSRGSCGLEVVKVRQDRPLPTAWGDAVVLALGDLGQLFGEAGQLRFWQDLGRVCRRSGQRPWALCPAPTWRWDHRLMRDWNVARWDRGAPLPAGALGQHARPEEDREGRKLDQIKRLRTLVSAPVRVGRGLLRDLRLLDASLDAAAEYDLWESDLVRGTLIALSLTPEQARSGRGQIAGLPKSILPTLCEALMRHYRTGPELFRHMAVLGLLENLSTAQRVYVDARIGEDVVRQVEEAAWNYYMRLAKTFGEQAQGRGRISHAGAVAAIGGRDLTRYEAPVKQHDTFQCLWATMGVFLESDRNIPLPDFVDPEKIAWFDPKEETALTDRQVSVVADHLSLEEGNSGPGTPVVSLQGIREGASYLTENSGAYRPMPDSPTMWAGPGSHRATIRTDLARIQLEPVPRPEWAHIMAYDRVGIYAVLRVGKGDEAVDFRFRWIPPGRFTMGSPEDETGGLGHEGPKHLVSVTRGFWLGETPVTQAQWQVFGDENLSEFRGDQRPVEMVSWDDCGGFIDKLNGRFEGLEARLPFEYEWEYACRGGEQGAFSDGSACTEPEGKDPALENLGWYDQNSESQTHDVGLKQANRNGLYDMQGNVWEWCADGIRNYMEQSEVNPRGSLHLELEDVARVVRGGSWTDDACYCRSAYRDEGGQGIRYMHLGFRLAAGQPAE